MTTTVLSRQEGAAMVLGGPTVVLGLGVNTEVIGFVLSGPGLPTVYLSGDNASIAIVAEIARRAPASTRPSCTPVPPESRPSAGLR